MDLECSQILGTNIPLANILLTGVSATYLSYDTKCRESQCLWPIHRLSLLELRVFCRPKAIDKTSRGS